LVTLNQKIKPNRFIIKTLQQQIANDRH